MIDVISLFGNEKSHPSIGWLISRLAARGGFHRTALLDGTTAGCGPPANASLVVRAASTTRSARANAAMCFEAWLPASVARLHRSPMLTGEKGYTIVEMYVGKVLNACS